MPWTCLVYHSLGRGAASRAAGRFTLPVERFEAQLDWLAAPTPSP